MTTRYAQERAIAQGVVSEAIASYSDISQLGTDSMRVWRLVEVVDYLMTAAVSFSRLLDMIADGTYTDDAENAAQSIERAEKEADAQAAAGVYADVATEFLRVQQQTALGSITPIADNSHYPQRAAEFPNFRPDISDVDLLEGALRDRFGDRLGVDAREIAICAVTFMHNRARQRMEIDRDAEYSRRKISTPWPDSGVW